MLLLANSGVVSLLIVAATSAFSAAFASLVPSRRSIELPKRELLIEDITPKDTAILHYATGDYRDSFVVVA